MQSKPLRNIKKRRVARALRAFTLIELLLVVAIIVTLAAIAIPYFQGQRKKARGNAGVATLKTIQKAQELYEHDKDTYLPSATDFNSLAAGLQGYIEANGSNLTRSLQQFTSYSTTGTTWQLDVLVEGAPIRATEALVCCINLPDCTYVDDLPQC